MKNSKKEFDKFIKEQNKLLGITEEDLKIWKEKLHKTVEFEKQSKEYLDGVEYAKTHKIKIFIHRLKNLIRYYLKIRLF